MGFFLILGENPKQKSVSYVAQNMKVTGQNGHNAQKMAKIRICQSPDGLKKTGGHPRLQKPRFLGTFGRVDFATCLKNVERFHNDNF